MLGVFALQMMVKAIHSALQVFEAAEEALKTEEQVKERLCQELNLLVQQSAHAQLEKLEQVRGPQDLMPCVHFNAWSACSS